MWPTHCVQDSFGAEFHKDLDIQENYHIIRKGLHERTDSYSGFGTKPEDTGLNKHLQDNDIKTVYVVGLAYDYCVGKTAEDAAKNGFKTYVIMDATKAIAKDTTEKMDQVLADLNVEKITSADIPTN